MRKLLFLSALFLMGSNAQAASCSAGVEGTWICGGVQTVRLSFIRDQNADFVTLREVVDGIKTEYALNLGRKSTVDSIGNEQTYKATCNGSEVKISLEEAAATYSYKTAAADTMVWTLIEINREKVNDTIGCVKIN